MKALLIHWQRITEGLLLFRVMAFNFGVILLALPVAAFVSGTVLAVNDGSFYFLLSLLIALGLLLIYSSTSGSDESFSKVTALTAFSELWLFLALLTMALPVTFAIRYWKDVRRR
jgi:hypothetical protein